MYSSQKGIGLGPVCLLVFVLAVITLLTNL